MQPSNSVILITGGSSGLGWQMSRQFLALDNQAIICAKNIQKLENTKMQLPDLQMYSCDIANQEQRVQLCDWILTHHPKLNMLISNAAIVHVSDFLTDDEAIHRALAEMHTNFMAPAHLTERLLLQLIHNQASIINITSGLAYVPSVKYSFYNAAKATLHSFTQVLRAQLKDEPIRIEVLLPVVDTPFHAGRAVSKVAISAQAAVDEMLAKLTKAGDETHIIKVTLLYHIHRLFPKLTFQKLNNRH